MTHLPPTWQAVPLDSLTQKDRAICYGVVQPGPEDPEGVQFIRGGDIQDGEVSQSLRTITHKVAEQYRRTNLVGGEIVISLVGYPGQTAIVPKYLAGANVARQVGVIAIRPEFDTEYVQHFLASPIGQDALLYPTIGSAQQVINIAELKRVNIVLPPFDEQRAISRIINIWDRGIRQLTDLIAAKVRFKQGLMQQLLTGKRRFPESSGEWNQVGIGELVSVRKDARTPSEECPLYSLTIEDGITPKSERYDRLALVRDKGKKTYKVVRPLDIVFNPSNLRWGAIGISRESHEVVVSPIYEVVYVTDESVVDPTFLFQALSAPHQIARFATMCEGTLVERMAVKLPVFLNCHIPFPPTLAEQKRIARILAVADRDICLHRQQLEAIKQQKKGLMQKLLTGEVRLKEFANG